MKKLIIKFLILLHFSFIITKNKLIKKPHNNEQEDYINNDIEKKSNLKSFLLFFVILVIIIGLLIFIFYKLIKDRNANNNLNYNLNNEENERLINNNEIKQKNIELKKKIFLLQNELKPIHYTNEIQKISDKCPICIEEFKTNSKIILTPCNHTFHYKCLKKYLLENKNIFCPLCKFDFMKILENKKIDFNNINLKLNEEENESIFIQKQNSNILNNNLNNYQDINVKDEN